MYHPPELPKDACSIVELLTMRALYSADSLLYRFLEFTGYSELDVTETDLTYGQLHQRAMSIGGWLQAYGKSRSLPIYGQRVLLVFPAGLGYLSAYFGCLYAGAVAVPAYPPRRNRRADRLRSIVRDAGLSLVLAPGELIESLKETIEADEILSQLEWQPLDTIPTSASQSWYAPQLDRGTIAFLQYTSGSTGEPKGVMVTHGNLLHNQSLIRTHFGTHRSDGNKQPLELSWQQTEDLTETVVGWLPLHHDMGLIGNVLHPLYVGGRLIFMAPIDFLQKPVRWLEAISRYRATISGGPNFAYRLCTDEIAIERCKYIDLSSWKVAFNGAEPIDATVLRQFSSKFTPLGFQTSNFVPCYGMAETTLLVTSSTCGDEPVIEKHAASEIVGCGRIIPDQMDVRIVDPETLIEKNEGSEGEIWVSGESVAAGYWNRCEQTEQTFKARIIQSQYADKIQGKSLPSDLSGPSFLRTGDLGFQQGGQLYVTSRLKDLIIVRGVNYYPQDIERTVEQAHSSLQVGGGAAVAFMLDGEERVALIQEVRRSAIRQLDVDVVAKTILKSVLEVHELRIANITFIRPGGLPKTTSGKVQRGEAKRMLMAGQFNAIGSWQESAASLNIESSAAPARSNDQPSRIVSPSTFSIVSDTQKRLRVWLAERIGARLKIAPATIDVEQPFAHYGLDSLSAVRLAGEVSDYLGRSVPPTLAYEYPSIALLAAHLCGESAEGTCDSQSTPTNVTDNRGVFYDEAMAVIGIGCRLPGASSADQFWQLLREGRCTINECADVSDVREFTFGDRVPTRAGFITDVDKFDAGFFGIHAREADSIDPQQRLLLEVTWQAFEDAAIPVEQYSGKYVGVFVGAGNNDYSRLTSGRTRSSESAGNGYGATGNSLAMAANRISYTYDFRGPSFTVDTACSSSLVATHQAIRSLRSGECELAVVGGANLILSDETTASFAQANMLSPEGVCRTFSAGANGFVRGEGCAVLILKRLRQASADNNRIYAVLRGSAINQDGRTNGLTAPSRQAQQALIIDALRDAKVNAEDIDYVEAHGTSTELGDPIELRAIRGALNIESGRRASGKPLLVGSVKTNIGHLEAAAGIAGLAKVCLSLWHREIVPSLNFDQPNPHIDFQGIEVPTVTSEWPTSDSHQRRGLAGVSSFGFGGANAHLIVEQAPNETRQFSAAPDVSSHRQIASLLVCSARSEVALQSQIQQVTGFVEDCLDRDSHKLSRAAYTLAAGRSHHRYRAACVLKDSSLQWREGIVRGEFSSAWLFSGQGGMFPMAGKNLFASHRTFATHFEHAADKCVSIAHVDPRKVLWGEAENWCTQDVQPAIFALQWALAQTYRDLNIRPSVVVGHSLGEYAAACVADVFTFEDGLRIVGKRAEFTGRLQQRGGMLAVFADEAVVAKVLNETGIPVDIAAANGPRQTVVAGDRGQLERLGNIFQCSSITTRMMQTSHGFHSRLIDPILEEFEAFVRSIPLSIPKFPFVSSQTGRILEGAEASEVATPEYWRNNLRQPVRFFDSLKAIHGFANQSSEQVVKAAENFLGIEVGAGSTLSSIARASKIGLITLPGLDAGDHEVPKFLENLSQLYLAGAKLNWQKGLGYQTDFIALPTYPFDRERYWYGEHGGVPTANDRAVNASATSARISRNNESLSHPMLGQRLDLSTDDIVYEFTLDANSYLRDHVVAGAIVFPAAAILLWAEHARSLLDAALGLRFVSDLQISKPLLLDTKSPQACQLSVTRKHHQWEGRLSSKHDCGWLTHATWTYQRRDNESNHRSLETALLKTLDTSDSTFLSNNVAGFYKKYAEAGLEYGPAFAVVDSLQSFQKSVQAVCKLRVAENELPSIHPTLLDGCLQALAAADGNWGARSWLPVGCEFCRFDETDEPKNEYVVKGQIRELLSQTGDEVNDIRIADLVILTSDGIVACELTGLQLQATSRIDVDRLLIEESWFPEIRNQERAGAFAECVGLDFRTTRRLATTCALDESISLASLLDELEQVAGKSVVYIFQQLGIEFEVGQVIHESDLGPRLGIVPEYQRLLNRMIRILIDIGVVERNDDRLIIKTQHDRIALDRLFSDALRKFPHGRNEFQLLQRCVLGASSCLTQGADPLPLLFPADGGVSAAEVYRDSAGGRLMNRLVGTAIEELVTQLPPGRGIRVLELGAGTGATTAAVLPALPMGRSRYCFTDIASSFLSAARQQLSHHHNLEYQILDIETAPSESLVGKYDLVIASNVLHATGDLEKSIEHAKTLLTSGGLLMAVEGTIPIRWMDLTFGLTSGWWRYFDTKLRTDYPLISADKWMQMLSSQGFENPMIISPTLVESGNRHSENSLILARNSSAARPIFAATGRDRKLQERGQTFLSDGVLGESPQESRSVLIVGDCNADFVKAIADRIGEQEGAVSVLDWDCCHDFSPTSQSSTDQSAVGHSTPLPLVNEVIIAIPSCERGPDVDIASLVQRRSAELLRHLQHVMRLGELSAEANGCSLKVCLVTSGGHICGGGHAVNLVHATAFGIWRTLVLEQPSWKCVSIDLDPSTSLDRQVSMVIDELESGNDSVEHEIAFRDDLRLVRRLVPFPLDKLDSSASNRSLKIAYRGSLDGLQLKTDTRRQPAFNQIEIEVRSAGLNFRDVLNAMDLYPGAPALGAECVGVVTRVGSQIRNFQPGQRVAALTNESFADYVLVSADAVVTIPDALSWESAATIPVAYLTAATALFDLGKLQAGETVLIHSAAGGVGMAATEVATALGARVLATASPNKHALLKARGIDHVFNSRSSEFADRVLELTDGRGVDVILNSLDATRIDENLKSLAIAGRYVDITLPSREIKRKVDESDKQITYHSLDLARMITTYPVDMACRLANIFSQIEREIYKPLPVTVYSLSDFMSAFRQLRDGGSSGKLIICPATCSKRSTVEDDQSLEGWQVITGGLGGLGLLLAGDLASQGFKRIALVARRFPTETEDAIISNIRSNGTDVEVFQADVSDFHSLASTFRDMRRTFKLVSGVYHLAGRLDDATIARQTYQSISQVYSAKVFGSWNLHLLTCADQLARFVMYSSASAVFGSPGQANHASANAFLDALAQYRQAANLPAISINWGPWSEIGAAAMLSVHSRADLSGIGMLSPVEGSEICRRILRADAVSVPAKISAVKIELDRLPAQIADDPLFARWKAASVSELARATGLGTTKAIELIQLLSEADEAGKLEIMSSHLSQLIARTMGSANKNKIVIDQPFFEMGMDSLTTLELVNGLKDSLGISISTNELFNHPTIQKLSKRLVELCSNRFEKDAVSQRAIQSEPVNENVMRETQMVRETKDNRLLDSVIDENNEIASLLDEIGTLSEEFHQWEASR